MTEKVECPRCKYPNEITVHTSFDGIVTHIFHCIVCKQTYRKGAKAKQWKRAKLLQLPLKNPN